MRKSLKDVLLSPAELELRRFSAGEVAEFLGVEPWRLQKFLNSPQFGLSSAGQLVGKGRGSRRTFSRNDLYLIGLAALLVRDGFAAKLIGRVVEYLHDIRLASVDERGDEFTVVIALARGAKEPEIQLFSSEELPKVGVGKPFYYAVDLNDVIQPIEKRIAKRDREEKRREDANR